jgi:hypothetical protein
MGLRKGERSFHTIYDDETLENMKRYYGLDNKDELLEFIKRNHLVRLDEVDTSKSKSQSWKEI